MDYLLATLTHELKANSEQQHMTWGFMLKLRNKNNKHQSVWLVEPKVTLGSATDNDLVVEADKVEAHHAEILVKHEHLSVVNLTADNSVRVNGLPVTDATTLNINDELQLSGISFEVVDPKAVNRPSAANNSNNTGWALKANHTALANRIYPLKADILIGRSSECDISLGVSHLSRKHARMVVKNGMLFVKDLDSSNGTFLNGKKVSEARVKRGDELAFDTLVFGVIGPSDELDKTTVRAVKKPVAPQAGQKVNQKAKPNRPSDSSAQPQTTPKNTDDSPQEQATKLNPLLWIGVTLIVAGAAAYFGGFI